MRAVLPALLLLALTMPLASAQVAEAHRAAFAMGQGFDDTLIVVSGRTDLTARQIESSAAFFRTSGVEIGGLSQVCWTTTAATDLECVEGPITLEVPAGSSFGFKSATPYMAEIQAGHGLVTFVDLSKADGFDGRLHVGPSAIMSMVGGEISIGDIPAFPPGSLGGFTSMERDSIIRVRGPGGLLLHTMTFEDEPLVIEGKPEFKGDFAADVAVIPFNSGATATFAPAKEAAARSGLKQERLDLLDEILQNVRFLGPEATAAPQAIVEKAGAILSEVFNGAFIRARLGDNPQSLGDVGFAKFDELTVTDGRGSTLDFDGSYTLVVGDLGTSFEDSDLAGQELPVRWWIIVLFALAAVTVGVWLWRRDGPLQHTEPGPQHWVARVASAIGAIALFLVWDWQLNRVMGSSVLTTNASGSSFGVLLAVELATLALALVLIGLPVFLAVRYGLGLLRKPHLVSLSATAAVFVTMALGILILPALTAFLFNFVA